MNMDVVKNSCLPEGSLSNQQPASGLQDGFVSGSGCSGSVVQTCEPTKNSDFESFRSNDAQYCSQNVNAEPLQQQVLVDIDDTKLTETEIVAPELTGLQKCGQVLVSQCGTGQMVSASSILESEPCDAAKQFARQHLASTQNNAVNAERASGGEVKTPVRSRKRRSTLALPVSNRILRSRSIEKSRDCEPKDDVVEEEGATEANKRKRRKKKLMRKMPVDQFSRIKAHLRYLLHRIKYEQNLIDAYSGEGWKGQSLEKIKPEKELQRAKSHIFRYKLKIRDLFQRIDMSLAEGKLPESLFDADGQIDSEDIFCAKCGSKDLTLDNDIILCDGACERGFHQLCLETPLRKEDIPPDEEGWLCPGCDCKVDCMEMLRDFQGPNFSVFDKWENVFPEEVAAAASGVKMDDYSGLPSDESEDDDYDPDKPELNKMEVESGSEGSDYYSACDGHVTTLDDKQSLGLPSDDSEDDNFDPSAPDDSDHVKQESSSSDFTSDSEGEDLNAILDGNEQIGEERRHASSVSDQSLPRLGSVGEKVKVGRAKRQSLSDEMEYLLQSNDAPISAKRNVERLDYQKLHQETYGDASSDSSDEDYGGTALPKKRKNCTRKATLLSINKPQTINNGGDSKDGNHSQSECENTASKKMNKSTQVGSLKNYTDLESTTAEGGSNGKSSGRSYARLDEAAVQRLLQSFRENQYPKHTVKESLAKELGLRIQQVGKWFENARWSSRHSSRMESKMAGGAPANGTSSPQISEKVPVLRPKTLAETASSNGPELTPLPHQASPCMEEGSSAGVAKATSSSASRLKSRKRRGAKLEPENLDELSSAKKTRLQDSHGDTSKSHAVRRSSRLQTRNSS